MGKLLGRKKETLNTEMTTNKQNTATITTGTETLKE